MLVEKAHYQGLDLRFWPPIETGRLQPDSLPFAGLITIAIMGPDTPPGVLAEEQPTAETALDRVETTIETLEGMDGGLEPDLGDELRTNVIAAYLQGKIAVTAARSVEAEAAADHAAAA